MGRNCGWLPGGCLERLRDMRAGLRDISMYFCW